MRKLNLLIWEAAIPPTLCALVTLVTYLTQVCNARISVGPTLEPFEPGQSRLLESRLPGRTWQALRHFAVRFSVSIVIMRARFGRP